MEKKVRIFDLNRDLAGQPLLSAEGHTSIIRNAVWDGARNIILSSGEDMEIRIWDPQHIQSSSLLLDGRTHCLDAIGRRWTAHYVDYQKVSLLWYAQTYTLRKQVKTEYDISAVSLHLNHTRFVAGGSSDLWMLSNRVRELEVYKGRHRLVHTVSYSPDGELYATGSEDGTIGLLQTTRGKNYGLGKEMAT